MPKKIGPEMLANLDQRLQSGEIDQPTYDARRAEVMELVRKGAAYSLSPREKALRIALGVALMALGGFIAAMMVVGGQSSVVALIISLAGLIYGANRVISALRH